MRGMRGSIRHPSMEKFSKSQYLCVLDDKPLPLGDKEIAAPLTCCLQLCGKLGSQVLDFVHIQLDSGGLV